MGAINMVLMVLIHAQMLSPPTWVGKMGILWNAKKLYQFYDLILKPPRTMRVSDKERELPIAWEKGSHVFALLGREMDLLGHGTLEKLDVRLQVRDFMNFLWTSLDVAVFCTIGPPLRLLT